MKEKGIYLCKGLLFSTLMTGALLMLVALLMYLAGIPDSVAAPLVVGGYLLADVLGGFYYARHAAARRFLWGLVFGTAFFLLYLILLALSGGISHWKGAEAVLFFLFSLLAGMAGGMLS